MSDSDRQALVAELGSEMAPLLDALERIEKILLHRLWRHKAQAIDDKKCNDGR